MSLAQIEQLLKDRAGLDAASVGSSAVAVAVRQRMAASGQPDVEAYWAVLQTSEEEIGELIEAVVVPETWFFRDRESFQALEYFVFTEWLPSHPGGVLRALSVPCSTGEEPCSMAMTLLDAGLGGDQFRIAAVDISNRALAAARLGVYGKNSFRGGELAFRERHFESVPEGFRLSEAVRRQVLFQQGNLSAPGLLTGEVYDVVWCRNLLIYFDRPTQDRVVASLERLLAPDGVLFVSAAETGVLSGKQFVSARLPMAFAFKRRLPMQQAPRPTRRGTPLAPAPFGTTSLGPPKRTVAQTRPGVVHMRRQVLPGPKVDRPRPPAKEEEDLQRAERLANEGHLAEAARLCEAHIRQGKPSAQVYYLLGLVRDAAGASAEAAALYRKALYLEPAHQEALTHLALLLERTGDNPQARRLRQRIHRAAQEGMTRPESALT